MVSSCYDVSASCKRHQLDDRSASGTADESYFCKRHDEAEQIMGLRGAGESALKIRRPPLVKLNWCVADLPLIFKTVIRRIAFVYLWYCLPFSSFLDFKLRPSFVNHYHRGLIRSVTPLDRETFLHIDTLELEVYNWNSKFSSTPLAKAIFRLAINNQLQVVILDKFPCRIRPSAFQRFLHRPLRSQIEQRNRFTSLSNWEKLCG